MNNVRYSVKKAKQRLHYKNIYSLEEGMKETIAWYERENIL